MKTTWIISNKKYLLTGLFLFLLLFLVSCKEKELEYPFEGPMPQSDIVFMPDIDPVYCKFNTKTLGFINADGSNRQEYTFSLIDGSASMYGVEITSQCAWAPRWSQDGDELVFGVGGQPPKIRLIDENGKMFGKPCEDIGAGGVFAFDLFGNVLTDVREEDLLYKEYMDIANPGLVTRYDLKRCEEIEVFSVPVEKLTGFGIQETENNLLVTSFWDKDEGITKIIIHFSEREETEILLGYHPSITKDGALLAYYNQEGTLVVRDIEARTERELIHLFAANDDWGPRFMSSPSWSPNYEWLTYNTPEGEIYKINIETTEAIYLTYGWTPDWR